MLLSGFIAMDFSKACI